MSEMNEPAGKGPGYETKDLRPDLILAGLLILAATVAGSLLGAGFLTRGGRPTVPLGSAPFTAAARARDLTEPLLQISPPAELARFRASEDSLLESYGWVDPDSGTVRVPIERAMQMVVEEGLPARSAAEAESAAAPDSVIRTESGFERRRSLGSPRGGGGMR